MRLLTVVLMSLLAASGIAAPQAAGGNRFSVSGDQVTFNGQSFKVIGLRTSNALISDAATQSLIDNLNVYKSYGVNTVSVFFMGSRFGDIKGYRPDASIEPVYAGRMGRIIEAADARGMIVLVGCLYWSTSKAKEDLGGWNQADANRAVANTVQWLKDNNYRNVFVDPDNEGMAHDATGWSIRQMIDAAHAVDPTIMVGYNDSDSPPSNADLYLHHSPKVSGAPWIQSEGSVGTPHGGYWGRYSKETHQNNGYYNYSRIGRYTSSMKSSQISAAKNDINNRNGYMMASTWIQCAPDEGVGGPFHQPGGRSNISNVDQNIDTLHSDAGVLWWLEGMKSEYGAWNPPAPGGGGGGGGGNADAFLEQGGNLVIEAEHFETKSPSTYTGYSQVHTWETRTDISGYSAHGFMHVLPDERGEDANGPSSPRNNTGAEMTYPIRITTAGTYNVWVRGRSMGGESNGIHLGIDGVLAGTGAGASNMSGFRPHNQWVWENGRKDGYVQPAILTLTAGDHTLNIWNRDDGFRIDKVYLTTSATTPSGQGPSESPRSGGGGGDGGSAQAVTSVTLINADTDQPIAGFDPLADGATLNLATLPTRNLSIRANPSPATVGSVRFAYDGNANYRTESTAPYAIAGDDPQGDYNPWTPSTGAHTLTLTPYTQSGGGGMAGTPLALSFTVIDQVGNQPPVVALTAPANGATFTAPATITLQATASDPDGTVSFVEFIQGGTLLGTTSASPYSYTWTNVVEGTYTLRAEATDNGATTVSSATVTITVSPGGGGGGTEAVTALTLINADTDLPVPGFDPILDGSTLNLGTLPTRNLNFNIHASPTTVGSVALNYDGDANYRTENNPPYAFAGDTSGDFDPWTPALGPHTLTATPYTQANRGGTAGTALTISFTVLDDPTTPSTNGPGGGGGGGAGGGGPAPASSSGEGSNGCGLTGLEALMALAAGLLLRRNRARR